jgi:hypothetical protein
MKDKKTNRWSTYEPFVAELAGRQIADIVVTGHAQSRWGERVTHEKPPLEEVSLFLWEKLENERIKPYDCNEGQVYLVDDDVQMVAEFEMIEEKIDLLGNSLYKMIVITFLGRLSENESEKLENDKR